LGQGERTSFPAWDLKGSFGILRSVYPLQSGRRGEPLAVIELPLVEWMIQPSYLKKRERY
jgi:hypothetical protein